MDLYIIRAVYASVELFTLVTQSKFSYDGNNFISILKNRIFYLESVNWILISMDSTSDYLE